MGLITLPPTQDAYISEYYPYQNFGLSEVLFIGRFLQERDAYRTLVHFNLNELRQIIPPSCEIENAWLEFTIIRNEIKKDSVNVIEIYRITEDWNEKTVKWNSQPGFLSISEAIYNISFQEQGIKRLAITNLVKGWYRGLLPNNGILIRGDEKSNCLVAFQSRKFSDATAWPRLIISYKPESITTYPELTLQVPACGVVNSAPLPLETAKQGTFLVRNIGKAEVDAFIELSDDSRNWEPSEVFSRSIPAVIGIESLTVKAVSQFARITLKGKESSTVIVSAATRG